MRRVKLEPLDVESHDRGAFSCGKDEIDRYFHSVAAQAANAHRSQTFVLTESESPTVMGFFTLAYHEYRDDEMDVTTARALKVKNLRRVPTVLLGQLGVDRQFQGLGLGPMLLNNALRRALLIGVQIGGVAVVTDPIDGNAASFYARYDFRRLPDQTRMLIAMKTLKETYPDVVAMAKLLQV